MQHQQHVRETTKQRNEQLHGTPRFNRTHRTRQHAFLQLQRHFPIRPILFVGPVQITKALFDRGRVQTMPVAIQYHKSKQWDPDQIHKHGHQCNGGIKQVRALPAFKAEILVQD